jgi:hypothetical protein
MVLLSYSTTQERARRLSWMFVRQREAQPVATDLPQRCIGERGGVQFQTDAAGNLVGDP